jgi:hypothetical protein
MIFNVSVASMVKTSVTTKRSNKLPLRDQLSQSAEQSIIHPIRYQALVLPIRAEEWETEHTEIQSQNNGLGSHCGVGVVRRLQLGDVYPKKGSGLKSNQYPMMSFLSNRKDFVTQQNGIFYTARRMWKGR